MRLRIILLQPRTPKKVIGTVIAITAPYNLMLLYTLTPKKHSIRIIDEYVENNKFESADLVAITSTTVTSRRAYAIADIYRRNGARVILGGMHPTLFPNEALMHADSVVIGEAEEIWKDIIEDAENHRLKRVYKQARHTDLSRISILDRTCIDERKYYAPYLIQCTRGCPHSCSFCSGSIISGKSLRKRPVNEIVKEIRNIKRHSSMGLHRLVSNKIPIFFIDDNIIADRSYAEKLFSTIVHENIYWTGQIPIYIAKDERLLALAYKSGLRVIIIGYESINRRSIKEAGKYDFTGEYISLTRKIRERGIMIYGQFMFGFDSDDISIFKRTEAFIASAGIDFCEFYIIKPYPGTELRGRLEKEGRITGEVWDENSYLSFVPKQMSKRELVLGVAKISKDFYSLPRIAMRMLKCIASRRSFSVYKIAYMLTVNLFNWRRVGEIYRGIREA